MKPIYMVIVGDEPPEFARSKEEALEKARKAIRELYDPNTLQWGDNVDQIMVAEVIAVSHERDQVYRPDESELDEEGFDKEGIDWSGGHEYICDYGLVLLSDIVDEEQPEPQLSALIH
jgi:hypothetical protein